MEISEIIIYLIKVIAIQGVFFAFYWLLLRNRPNHALNRLFLLSTLLLSLVIPFIERPVPEKVEPIMDVVMLEWMAEPIEFVATEIQTTKSSQLPIWTMVGFIYFGLLTFFIGRSTLHLYLLQKIKKQCEYVKKHWFKLFKTTQSRPFSFFSSVFIPREIFGTDSFDQILAHECVHVRQLHSLDRLLLDFLVSLFWFNPFIYLYRNALIEVHEYQADAEVVKEYNDLVGYQEILFAQLQSAPYSGLVSHFNFSTIKKRIVMMNKSKNHGQSRLTYVLTLPLVAMVLLAFTSKESNESMSDITDKIEKVTGPFDILSSFTAQEDNYRPSILPLRTDARFKLSSSFGRREDPIDKKVKQHRGVDFAVAIGAEVIATADGIVEEISNGKGGHGNKVKLNHGGKYATIYGQLSEIKVSNGDKVKKGQVIALSGNSGRSTGPHLHYEVFEGDNNVDPIDYIKNYKFASLHESQDNKFKESKSSIAQVIKKEEDHDAALAEAKMELAEKQRMKAEQQVVLAKASQRMAETESKIAEENTQRARLAKEEAEVQARYAYRVAQMEKAHVEKVKMKLSDKDQKPLFVLDGKVLENGNIENLEPSDIESINVIKGEVALEKYNDAGANGVIEITTKTAKSKDKEKDKDIKKDKRKNKNK